ncbi:MAG: hypothetical protein IPN62_13325 [Flavobacteriales bacterium]|nr:hypothetical protein [Flavobacteriales bacterium]
MRPKSAPATTDHRGSAPVAMRCTSNRKMAMAQKEWICDQAGWNPAIWSRVDPRPKASTTHAITPSRIPSPISSARRASNPKSK